MNSSTLRRSVIGKPQNPGTGAFDWMCPRRTPSAYRCFVRWTTF
jgi:hypothetical protein